MLIHLAPRYMYQWKKCCWCYVCRYIYIYLISIYLYKTDSETSIIPIMQPVWSNDAFILHKFPQSSKLHYSIFWRSWLLKQECFYCIDNLPFISSKERIHFWCTWSLVSHGISTSRLNNNWSDITCIRLVEYIHTITSDFVGFWKIRSRLLINSSLQLKEVAL